MISSGSGCENFWTLIALNQKRKKLCVAAAVLLLVFYLLYSYSFCEDPHPQRFPNYFPRTRYEEYAVSTPTCRIPNIISPDPAILSLLGPKVPRTDCREERRWTYLDDLMQTVILNFTAMKEAGYSPGSVECCYREIERAPDSDTMLSLSSSCVPLILKRTKLNVEFIKVTCISKFWPFFRDVVYQDHHALVQPMKNSATVEKVERWRLVRGEKRPPNVVMLGMDTLPRLNFLRTMHKTREVLEQLGAVELPGYTKVGENTFENAVPFLSGYSVQELWTICYSPDKPQDNCPYLWKLFNTSGYLTAHVEDRPYGNIFNYLKAGFARQQVDFYLRPLMLSAYVSESIVSLPCIGGESTTRKTLRYIRGLVNAAQTHRTPMFIFTWITDVAHDDPYGPAFVDEFYVDFLRETNLNRTIMFFMSDHGYRHGAYRLTDIGWYEDKLPTFWVYLSPDLRQERPDWLANLKLNSGRLTSPYDLYQTLVYIATEFTNSSTPADSQAMNGTAVRRQYGQSLLRELPSNRSCKDAGIGNEYCACGIPLRLDDLKDPGLVKAAVAAVDYLNNDRLPPQCARFTLKEVTAGASTAAEGSSTSSSWVYYVAFVVEPGEFPFEAAVEYDEILDKYTSSRGILRLNKISTSTDCVKESELERLCYCL